MNNSPDMAKENEIRLVECPRDAMQGWLHPIPTQKKIQYLNALLQVGFDTIDFGSFVSPKAIPQMSDTKEVIPHLQLNGSRSKLLAIIANKRGADEAVLFDEITYLGFPFSISPTFQLRNTNSSIQQSVETVDIIQDLCIKKNKQLVIYLSMGFGNPYQDPYTEEILLHWADKMAKRDIGIISLADTVGVATPQQINEALIRLIPQYPSVNFGVHLHASAQNAASKLEAALAAGCKRFDGALKGIGGCPMAQDELVGNMDTSLMIPYMEKQYNLKGINHHALDHCLSLTNEVFV